MGCLVEQRIRLEQHETGQKCPYAGDEGGTSELRERVVPAVVGYDIVRGLRTAVESNDCMRASLAGQEIDDRALAAVAEREVDDHDGVTVTHVKGDEIAL